MDPSQIAIQPPAPRSGGPKASEGRGDAPPGFDTFMDEPKAAPAKGGKAAGGSAEKAAADQTGQAKPDAAHPGAAESVQQGGSGEAEAAEDGAVATVLDPGAVRALHAAESARSVSGLMAGGAAAAPLRLTLLKTPGGRAAPALPASASSLGSSVAGQGATSGAGAALAADMAALQAALSGRSAARPDSAAAPGPAAPAQATQAAPAQLKAAGDPAGQAPAKGAASLKDAALAALAGDKTALAKPTSAAAPLSSAALTGGSSVGTGGAEPAIAAGADAGAMRTADGTAVRPAAQGHPGNAAAQLHAQISQAMANNHSRFHIRLQPAELGGVDVRLTVRDGGVTAHFLVDRPETLDLLQNQARQLERMLAEAGVRSDQSALNFSLKGEGGEGFGDESGEAGGGPLSAADVGEDAAEAANDPILGQITRTADGRLDIRL